MQRIIACFLYAVIFILPANAAKMVIQRTSGGRISAAALSPDGTYMVSSSSSRPMQLWQITSNALVGELPDSNNEQALAWSPDGKVLLTAAKNVHDSSTRPVWTVHVREMPSGKITRAMPGIHTPLNFDGNIIRCTDSLKIYNWNIDTGKLLSAYPLQNAIQSTDETISRHFAFSDNGKFLAYGGSGKVNRADVWDAQTGQHLYKIQKKDAAFGYTAISNDGRYLVTEGENLQWKQSHVITSGKEADYARNYTLHLWDLKTGKERYVLPGFPALDFGVQRLQFLPDKIHLFASGNNFAYIYNIQNGDARKIDLPYATSVSADGKVVLNGGAGPLQLISLETGKLLQSFPGSMMGENTLCWSPDGRFLTGSPLQIWDLRHATTTPANPDPRYMDAVSHLYWINNTTLRTENKSIFWWRLNAAGNAFTRFKKTTLGFIQKGQDAAALIANAGKTVKASPDAQWLLVEETNSRGALTLWDAAGKNKIRSLQIVDNLFGLDDFFWMPDSIHFIAPTERGLEIWNAQTGQRKTIIAPLPNSPLYQKASNTNPPVRLVAVSPDSKFLAATNAGEYSKGLQIWNTASGKLVRIIPSPDRSNAAFSPDGNRIAIGSSYQKNETEIWNWRDGQKPITTLPALGLAGYGWQASPAWSADSKRIAVGNDDVIQIFGATTGKLLAKIATGEMNDTPQPNDWIIWTPQGYFSAPDHGRKRVRWREDAKIIPLDSPRDKELRKKFCNPRMVAKAIMG